MAIVLETYPTIKKFSKVEPVIFINIPIQIGIGEQKFEPYIPEWFKKLEEDILHAEVNPKIWKLHKKTMAIAEIYEDKSNSVYWSRNTDGRHIEPEQIYYTKNNEKKIVQEASKQLWRKRPDFIAPGGNAYGQRERAQCLRDYGWYLRLVTYGVLAGSKEPIEAIGIIGAREMYNALGVPVPGMAEAIRCLKDASLDLLNTEDAVEAAPYFDYIIQAMS